MHKIITLDTRELKQGFLGGGCGECQTSCQSACKTSCGIANQSCENNESVKLPRYAPVAMLGKSEPDDALL